MKAKDLAETLLKNPEMEVRIAVIYPNSDGEIHSITPVTDTSTLNNDSLLIECEPEGIE